MRPVQFTRVASPASPSPPGTRGVAPRQTRFPSIDPVTRRRFIGTTAAAGGILLGSGSLWPAFARKTCAPKPIPQFLDLPAPLPDIHVQLPGVPGGTPLDTDPSTITDFNGFVGLAVVDGTGTRTNLATGARTRNTFEVDLRFMSGEFVGEDGRHCHSAFALV